MQEESTLVSFDWAIKYLLRNKADYVILEGFLTTLLGKKINIQSLVESESNKVSEGDKYNRTDVLAEEEDGTLIIIELQFTPEIDYFHRMLFGLSEAVEKLEYSRLSREERRAYDKYVDICRSNRSTVYTAKLEGKAEGEAIVEARGVKKTAKNMKDKGSDVAFISEVTGLSAEEIIGL
jgi:hypothetical protein